MPHRKKKSLSLQPEVSFADSENEKEKSYYDNISLGSRENRKTFSFEDILSQRSQSQHSQFTLPSYHASSVPCHEPNCTCESEFCNSSVKSAQSKKKSEYFCSTNKSTMKMPTPSASAVFLDFIRKYLRLVAIHFMITCTLLFTFFPVLNFFWTYYADEEREVETLLQYITDESSTGDGMFYHLRRMKWLGVPTFTIEALTCLFSTIVASVVTAIWLQRRDTNHAWSAPLSSKTQVKMNKLNFG